MKSFLSRCIACPSESGQERKFVQLVADWAGGLGFEIDLWEADEQSLVARYPEAAVRHIPLAGRPTLLVRLPGTGGGRSLLFNAHADVVPAGDLSAWEYGPWSGAESDGRIFGRGACDDKGPLVSALWAMNAIRQSGTGPAGDLALELVVGEEDCVGLGTLVSIDRGHRADAAIVLEPTEGLPRCASRGGLRFRITAHGRAVHGTVKWLGRDAIQFTRRILAALDTLQPSWNDRAADPLFAPYPFVRPITVDFVSGGVWQGMVCDRCTCAGYLELLPGDDPAIWSGRLESELLDILARGPDPIARDEVEFEFVERYDGHRTPPEHPLCQTAQRAVARWRRHRPDSPAWPGWSAFNSGCEAGMRARLLETPTLVWGPGSLADAHAVDESINWDEVQSTAAEMALAALEWVG
jgi:acetylornithine deacetylase